MLWYKMWLLPHDATDMPKQLPMGLSQCVLTKYVAEAPPHHMAVEDADGPLERVVVDRITGHYLVRGRGGNIAVMYQAHWKGIMRVTRGREVHLRHFRSEVLLHRVP